MSSLLVSTSEDIPTYVKDLLVQMEFIGGTKPGKKLCVKTTSYSDPTFWYTAPVRYIHGEDGTRTCDYIDRTLTGLTEALRTYTEYSNPKIRKTLIEKSRKLREGLVNLLSTYHDNPEASSKLKTYIELLDIKVPENKIEIPVQDFRSPSIFEDQDDE